MGRAYDDDSDGTSPVLRPNKSHARAGDNQGYSNGSRHGQHVFKVLCPDALVANIIGKGGDTRKKIQEETSARLQISSRDEFFPNSRYRILVATASKSAQILQALEEIVARLVEVADAKGKRGDDLTGIMDDGEYIFCVAIPAACTGALIGPQGSRVKALQAKTGARLIIENAIFQDHKMLQLKGSCGAITAALPKVHDTIVQELPREKLEEWAAVLQFAEPRGGRGDHYYGGGDAQGDGGRRGWQGRGDVSPGRGRWHEGDSWRRSWQGGDSSGNEYHEGASHSLRKRSRMGSRSRSRHRDNAERREDNDAEEVQAPLELMEYLRGQFPRGGLGMQHAIMCDLANACVGSLIGRKGEHVNTVQRKTGAVVSFSKAEESNDPDHKTMSIQGPLLAVYAAHMLMMQKYHEGAAREEARARQAEEGGRGGHYSDSHDGQRHRRSDSRSRRGRGQR